MKNPNPLLITMRGPAGDQVVDFSKLSNFEAGVLVLDQITYAFPGITWGQLRDMALTGAGSDRMGGWWTDLKKTVTAPIRDVSSMVGDVIREGGHGVFDFLRDDKIQENVRAAYKSYTDGGGYAGAVGGSSIFGGGGGSDGGGGGGGFMDKVMGFISSLGAGAKDKNEAGMFGGSLMPWAIAGGAILVLVFAKKA